MSDALLHAVRALQEPPPAQPPTPPRTGGVNPDPGQACAGAFLSASRAASLPPPPQAVQTPDDLWEETERETEPVTLYAADGSGLAITLERILRISFARPDGARMTLVLHPPA